MAGGGGICSCDPGGCCLEGSEIGIDCECGGGPGVGSDKDEVLVLAANGGGPMYDPGPGSDGGPCATCG